jgi:hypothetical protein
VELAADRNEVGDIAADLTESGLWVFPCRDDKRPATPHGFKDAVGTPEEALALFARYPSASLIGVRTGEASDLLVIDADLYKGPTAGEYIQKLEEAGLLPPTRVHETRTGGLHYLYTSKFGYPALSPSEAVDVKGDGGYVVWWPASGHKVRSTGIAEAPEALITYLKAARATASEGTIASIKAAILKADNFHENLGRLAARYSAAGKPQEEVMVLLIEALRGSVASSPHHARHARWRDLLADAGQELSRIVTSGHQKFNPHSASENFAEIPEDVFAQMASTASKLFAPIPTDGDAAPVTYSGEFWPFLGEGYFAHEQHDLLNQKFIMHPLLCEDESVLIAAEPKTGKTALSLTIGLHIACGLDLGDSLKVAEPRSVIYFGLEGKRAIRLRIAAWRGMQEKAGVEIPSEIPMFVVERGQNLLDQEVKKDFVAKIIAADQFLQAANQPSIGVIFIDTLTKAMTGGDQNSVEDTSSMFEVVGMLREAKVTAAVVFIHHKGKAGTVRGSSNIEADPDVLSSVSKAGNEVTLRIDRARSVEEGGAYTFSMSNYDLGISSQGFMINAPVVEPVGFASTTAALNVALVNKKVFEVVVGMGKGRHMIADILHELFKVGLGPMVGLKGAVKKPASAMSPEATAFFNSLFPTIGEARIVGEWFVEANHIGGGISSLSVR